MKQSKEEKKFIPFTPTITGERKVKMEYRRVGKIVEFREGSKIGRWEGLSSGLVLMLWKLAKKVGDKKTNDIHISTELDLSKTEYNNFQKLRYHGLVAKVRDKVNQGHWLLTRRGGQFLKNAISLPRAVLISNNRIVEYDNTSQVRVSDFYGKYPHFETKFEYEIVDGGAIKVPKSIDGGGQGKLLKVTQTFINR